MDHQLSDESIALLAALPAEARSPEQVLSWARFICAAAGVEFDSPTPLQQAQSELHAATALLAKKLGAVSFTSEHQMRGQQDPELTACIHVGDGVVLLGRGSSAAQVLRALHQDASRCKAVAQ